MTGRKISIAIYLEHRDDGCYIIASYEDRSYTMGPFKEESEALRNADTICEQIVEALPHYKRIVN